MGQVTPGRKVRKERRVTMKSWQAAIPPLCLATSLLLLASANMAEIAGTAMIRRYATNSRIPTKGRLGCRRVSPLRKRVETETEATLAGRKEKAKVEEGAEAVALVGKEKGAVKAAAPEIPPEEVPQGIRDDPMPMRS
jgi:hypothetical protein